MKEEGEDGVWSDGCFSDVGSAEVVVEVEEGHDAIGQGIEKPHGSSPLAIDERVESTDPMSHKSRGYELNEHSFIDEGQKKVATEAVFYFWCSALVNKEHFGQQSKRK